MQLLILIIVTVVFLFCCAVASLVSTTWSPAAAGPQGPGERYASSSQFALVPSALARRVISACGLNDLLAPSPEMAGEVTERALGSWVAVPTAERSDGQPRPTGPMPERVPACVGPTSALRARGREHRRASGDRMTKVAVHGGP